MSEIQLRAIITAILLTGTDEQWQSQVAIEAAAKAADQILVATVREMTAAPERKPTSAS